MTKICTKCGIEKDIDEFSLSSYRSRKSPNTPRLHVAACKECANKANAKYYVDTNRVSRYKERRHEIRQLVFEHYGNECACCGEKRAEFLSIDHIYGGGREHRKTIGSHINEWLFRNNFPEGFRTLCHNCNFARGIYGFCPHEVEIVMNEEIYV